jgi:hypothetical protein
MEIFMEIYGDMFYIGFVYLIDCFFDGRYNQLLVYIYMDLGKVYYIILSN